MVNDARRMNVNESVNNATLCSAYQTAIGFLICIFCFPYICRGHLVHHHVDRDDPDHDRHDNYSRDSGFGRALLCDHAAIRRVYHDAATCRDPFLGPGRRRSFEDGCGDSAEIDLTAYHSFYAQTGTVFTTRSR